jgi:hypothetical protein
VTIVPFVWIRVIVVAGIIACLFQFNQFALRTFNNGVVSVVGGFSAGGSRRVATPHFFICKVIQIFIATFAGVCTVLLSRVLATPDNKIVLIHTNRRDGSGFPRSVPQGI